MGHDARVLAKGQRIPTLRGRVVVLMAPLSHTQRLHSATSMINVSTRSSLVTVSIVPNIFYFN